MKIGTLGVIIILLQSHILCAFIHVTDEAHYQHMGYGNGDQNSNGEVKALQTFIKPHDTVVDAGANVGEWSTHVLLAHNDVIIHAFEPIPDVFKQLTATLQGKAHVNEYALFKTNGIVQFDYYPTGSVGSGVYNRPLLETWAGKPQKIVVNTICLDDYCMAHNINHINFLKIDTEGSELDVLLGAIKLISKKNIEYIQFEYGGAYTDAKITLKTIYTLLTNYGYKICRLSQNHLIHVPQWYDGLESYTYANYLAIASH